MAELIIRCVNIFLILFAAGYFLLPMADRMLNQRRIRIAEGIESAENCREAALLSREEYERRIENFEKEYEAIMHRARERAEMAEAELLKEAAGEAGEIVERAVREAALRKAKVQDEIKKDMIYISEKLAEKFIIEGMTAGKQKLWIADILNKMGEKTWKTL